MKLKLIALMCLSSSLLYCHKNKEKKDEKMEKDCKAFNQDIVKLCKKNDNFRKEVVTGKHSQVVLMSIPVGQDIGEETHADVDQTLIFVDGKGQAIIEGVACEVEEDRLVFVPAGTKHNFKNTGSKPLKLYTIYAPIEHKPGTIEKNKGDLKEE